MDAVRQQSMSMPWMQYNSSRHYMLNQAIWLLNRVVSVRLFTCVVTAAVVSEQSHVVAMISPQRESVLDLADSSQ
jgi:hypothetical protein